jgi:predicted transposase/invertase (TIGR01784 family)
VKKQTLGTDNPFFQLMKLAGSSMLKLAGIPAPEQYRFDATVLKDKRLEPDIQGLPILDSDLDRIFMEFQGYPDEFFNYRFIAQVLQSCHLDKYRKQVRLVVFYTDEKYRQASYPLNQLSPTAHFDIHEIVLTNYTLQQLLDIDAKLVVLAPFTADSKLDKDEVKQHLQQWSTTLKQAYPVTEQRDALNLLSLFLLDRFRNVSYEEIIAMMNFNLLDSRAGQDILEIGRNKGRQEGRLEGRLEERLELVKKHVLSMLKEGLSIDLIKNVTQLSEKDIKAIQEGNYHRDEF